MALSDHSTVAESVAADEAGDECVRLGLELLDAERERDRWARQCNEWADAHCELAGKLSRAEHDRDQAVEARDRLRGLVEQLADEIADEGYAKYAQEIRAAAANCVESDETHDAQEGTDG